MRASSLAGLTAAFLLTTWSCGFDGPAGVAGSGSDTEPRPVVFDWVGRWSGAATGHDAGTPVEESVELVISFDQDPECSLCVRIRLQDLFDRAGFRITDPIRTEFSYVADDARHWILLERFSSGSGPGNTILGRVEVRERNADGEFVTLVRDRDLELRKDP